MAKPAAPPAKVPTHVALILDGNGRWAKQRKKPRVFGHAAGVKAIAPVVNEAIRAGVGFVSIFAFSTENWNRPKAEVAFLMGLPSTQAKAALKAMNDHGVRLVHVGFRDKVPPRTLKAIDAVVAATAANTRLTLVLCFNYGGRQDIAQAACAAGGADVEGHLLTAGIPPVDLLIRTGGEKRLSNFLLWQSAYAELVFTDTLWPDYGPDEFASHLAAYGRRDRRFGRIS